MGNQPSAPSAPPPPTPSPPPLPPPCDMDCQKQKNLALLKTALDTATENQDQDPDGYEKARIAYYTLLNGQGWLQGEKQRIAKEEVEPVISTYNTKYNALKGEKQSQSIFVNLADGLKAQEGADKEDNAFLKKQMTDEKNKADVLNRLNELNSGTPVTQQPNFNFWNYIPIIIDVIILILIVGVLYFAYTKMNSIKQILGISVPSITT
jgi:hypothetical protein